MTRPLYTIGWPSDWAMHIVGMPGGWRLTAVQLQVCMTGRLAHLPCSAPQVLTHLAGMPEQSMKWQTAVAPLASNPPLVRLLGYFTAGQTEKAAAMLQAVSTAGDASRSCKVPF